MNIKTVGFRADKDSKIITANFIDVPVDDNSTVLDDSQRERVIEYLENGLTVLALTFQMFDGEDIIGPYIIKTDGEWIWPTHLTYYLKKNDFRYIKNDFLVYLRENNFKEKEVSPITRKEVVIYLEKEILNM